MRLSCRTGNVVDAHGMEPSTFRDFWLDGIQGQAGLRGVSRAYAPRRSEEESCEGHRLIRDDPRNWNRVLELRRPIGAVRSARGRTKGKSATVKGGSQCASTCAEALNSWASTLKALGHVDFSNGSGRFMTNKQTNEQTNKRTNRQRSMVL